MIYKDFYTPNNMFVIVVGNFNKDEVINFIRNYMKRFKLNNNKITINKIKEPDKVKIAYEIVNKRISEDKVYYSIKINKNTFENINKIDLNYYLQILLSSNFSTTSFLYEKYKNQNIITSMKSDFKIFDNHIIITVKAVTPNSNEFVKNIKNDIKNISILPETFERKKKKILSSLILSFENIEDVEYLITNNILLNKKLYNKDYRTIKNLKFDIMTSIIKKINFDNQSILICTK